MNCTICGKPIILVPSARTRAAAPHSHLSEQEYKNLFREHTDCFLAKRKADTSAMMAKYYPVGQ